VRTVQATVINVNEPLPSPQQARAWLRNAGEADLSVDLAVLNQALHAYRLVTADPHTHTVSRRQVLVARVGYGAGEQVADGLWTDARELPMPGGRQARAKVLAPQARLAAILGGRETPLVCEELVLRARSDLDQGRERAAALQLLVALDAALAELTAAGPAAALGTRLDELRTQRDPVTRAAQTALAGPLDDRHRETITCTLSRIEAALRARAAAGA
jgi:hypothetical protein